MDLSDFVLDIYTGGVAGFVAREVADRLEVKYYIRHFYDATISFDKISVYAHYSFIDDTRKFRSTSIDFSFEENNIIIRMNNIIYETIDISDPEFDMDALAMYVFLLYLDYTLYS